MSKTKTYYYLIILQNDIVYISLSSQIKVSRVRLTPKQLWQKSKLWEQRLTLQL